MKMIARLLGTLGLLATLAPAALADEPCDRDRGRTFVRPAATPVYYPEAPVYAPQAPAYYPEAPVYAPGYADPRTYAPAPAVVRPEYDRRWRWEAARRAEEARHEAWRRWRAHERREHRRGYDRDDDYR